jgi:D-arabinose 1-dehydrogenase-like Zn-dependent alcohol dehydrogenase
MTGTDGGLAEYLVVEAKNARKVPASISLEVAGKSQHCSFESTKPLRKLYI